MRVQRADHAQLGRRRLSGAHHRRGASGLQPHHHAMWSHTGGRAASSSRPMPLPACCIQRQKCGCCASCAAVAVSRARRGRHAAWATSTEHALHALSHSNSRAPRVFPAHHNNLNGVQRKPYSSSCSEEFTANATASLLHPASSMWLPCRLRGCMPSVKRLDAERGSIIDRNNQQF